MRKCEIAKNAKDYIHDLVTLKNETPHDSNKRYRSSYMEDRHRSYNQKLEQQKKVRN